MTVKLLIVHGRPQGKSLLFPDGEYVFGRGAECHIRPNSEWVSRQHCLLRVTPEGTYVRDLGSRNGTLINGVRVVSEHRLEPGDQLQVGPLVFSVGLEETPVVTTPASQEETGIHAHETAELPFVRPNPNPATDTLDASFPDEVGSPSQHPAP